jgi:uncharacterized protein YukE
MDFGVDVGQLDNLATELNSKADDMENIISSIYSKIAALEGNGWSGEGYNDFKAECEAYKGAVEQIPGVIRDFATFFSGTATTNANDLHGKAVKGKGLIG